MANAFDGTLIDRTMSRLEFGVPPVKIDLVTVVGDYRPGLSCSPYTTPA